MGNWTDYLVKTSGSTDLDQDRTHNEAGEIAEMFIEDFAAKNKRRQNEWDDKDRPKVSEFIIAAIQNAVRTTTQTAPSKY